MLGTNTRALLDRARGPLGPGVAIDFGDVEGPLQELGELLSEINGFFAFNAGIQVFHAGDQGDGPELSHWNSSEAWKESFEGLADDFFCFAQDILGMQHAILGGTEVVRFDPETARHNHIGGSLEEWASWVLADPAMNATAVLAKVWQDRNGALEPDQRLIPLKALELGGEVSFDNLAVKDSVEAMRARGPVAVQIRDLPPGTEIHLQS